MDSDSEGEFEGFTAEDIRAVGPVDGVMCLTVTGPPQVKHLVTPVYLFIIPL